MKLEMKIRNGYRLMAAGSRPLAVLAVGSAGLLAATLILMVVDPRQLLGAPLWLKPAKFAASIVIAAATLALLLRHIRLPERGGRRAIALIVAFSILELAAITLQAARGVASHFNAATPVDVVLFAAMGIGIVIFTLAIGYIAVVAFRQRFADRALGWGIRLGFVAMLLGSAIAFLMPRPTPSQIASMQAGRPTPAVGAHAVGVDDGGPGLPVTGWSTEGGDLRAPHFIGLHGLQILPLAGWLLGRRRVRAGLAARQSVIVGLGYLGLVVTTLIQALRARPLLSPDGVTIVLALTVVCSCAVAALVAARNPVSDGSRQGTTLVA